MTALVVTVGGIVAIIAGIALLSVPAAVITGGIIAVLFGLFALEAE